METSLKNWRALKLGDVVKLNYGKALPKQNRKSGDIFVYGSNGVVGQHDVPLVKFPTIVIGRKGSAGKVALSLNPAWIIDTAFYTKIVNQNIDLKYLYLFCSALSNNLILPKGVKPGINRNEYLSNEIPLPFRGDQPDIEEQKRIADKIDKMFVEIKEAVKQTDASLWDVNNLLQSELRKVFFLNNLTSFNLDKLLLTLESGGRPKGGAVKEGVSSIGAEHLNDYGSLDFYENPKYIPTDYFNKMKRGIIKKEDILIVKDGATTSKTSYISNDYKLDKSAVNEHVFILRTIEMICPKYLFYFLFSDEGKREIMLGFGGAAQGGINKTFIKNIKLPVPVKNGKPDINRQQKIVARLDKIYGLVVNAKKEFENQLTLFKLLQQSILNYSFAGKLITVAETEPIKINYFPIQQAIGSILQRFERGEMVIAKILYLAQTVNKVSFAIPFTPQNFGPYDKAVKLAITSGLSHSNKFFIRKKYGKGYIYALSQGSQRLFNYSNTKTLREMNEFLDEMMPHFRKVKSTDIERLASVCEIIKNTKNTNKGEVYKRLSEWKPNKFTFQEVDRSLNFIKTKGWDKILTK